MPFDADRMRAAAGGAARRHPNLRAAFRQRENGAWVQVVPRDVELPWRSTTSGLSPRSERDSAADRSTAEAAGSGFDLATAAAAAVHGCPDRRRTGTGWS